MPRKPNNYTRAFDEGYKKGWDARSLRSIQDDPSLWNWADWFAYVFATMIVAAIAIVIFGLLTLWISWASDHRDHPHCGFTSTGEQWCTK